MVGVWRSEACNTNLSGLSTCFFSSVHYKSNEPKKAERRGRIEWIVKKVRHAGVILRARKFINLNNYCKKTKEIFVYKIIKGKVNNYYLLKVCCSLLLEQTSRPVFFAICFVALRARVRVAISIISKSQGGYVNLFSELKY